MALRRSRILSATGAESMENVFTRFACDTGTYPLRVNIGERNQWETCIAQPRVGAIGTVLTHQREHIGTAEIISASLGPGWGEQVTTAWTIKITVE